MTCSVMPIATGTIHSAAIPITSTAINPEQSLEGVAADQPFWHAHEHCHGELEHAHPHVSDTHHRHRH